MCTASKVDLDLDLDFRAKDLGLPDLQDLLAQHSSADEDKDLDLESPFTVVSQVEVEETVVDPPPEQVRVVDLGDYGPHAEIDIENTYRLQQKLIR